MIDDSDINRTSMISAYNSNMCLTRKQFLDVLYRIRNTIENEHLQYIHNDTSQTKFLYCNWGLCGDIKKHYPFPEYHTRPKEFAETGKVTSLRPATGYDCPFRERLPSDTRSKSMSGCYHSCRAFQKDKETPDKETALKLYDKMIIRVINDINNGENNE